MTDNIYRLPPGDWWRRDPIDLPPNSTLLGDGAIVRQLATDQDEELINYLSEGIWQAESGTDAECTARAAAMVAAVRADQDQKTREQIAADLERSKLGLRSRTTAARIVRERR